MNYSYLGTEYTNYLGNYWYDYNDTERGATNVNGIWNVPYNVTETINDSYPLAGIVGLDIIVSCQTSEPEDDEETPDDGLIHLSQDDFTEEDGFIINEPGYYVLDENINCELFGIIINSSNVVVDGRGFYLNRTDPEDESSGICTLNETFENITIKNFGISNFTYGISVITSYSIHYTKLYDTKSTCCTYFFCHVV